jgi:hypothetical protein
MAKQNVQRLLDRIIAESQKDSKVRAEVNKKVHVYSVNIKDLWKELVDQLEGKYAKKGGERITLSPAEIEGIKRASIKYFNDIKQEIQSFNGSTFDVYTIFSGPTNIKVRVDSKSGNSSVFKNFISTVRSSPLKQLRTEIYHILKDSNSMNSEIRSRIFGTGQTTGGLLDPGHAIGTSITENRIGNYISDLDVMAKTASSRTTKGTNPIIDLIAVVKNNPRLEHLKTIDFSVVYVGEQGVDHNRNAQAVQEQILISSIKKQIKKSLDTVDWGNFRSSSSAKEMISKNILDTAKKSGAKVKSPKKLDTRGTKASSSMKQTIEKVTTDERGATISATTKKPDTVAEPTNWLKLLPIINSKLTPRVIANMKFPSLVNRTGTFAQSAKVTNVETTREGFPSFVFDYERDPYDVFDRTRGRSPWNTPERDPRALVDKSVREIVREMAISRFYTRRA